MTCLEHFEGDRAPAGASGVTAVPTVALADPGAEVAPADTEPATDAEPPDRTSGVRRPVAVLVAVGVIAFALGGVIGIVIARESIPPPPTLPRSCVDAAGIAEQIHSLLRDEDALDSKHASALRARDTQGADRFARQLEAFRTSRAELIDLYQDVAAECTANAKNFPAP